MILGQEKAGKPRIDDVLLINPYRAGPDEARWGGPGERSGVHENVRVPNADKIHSSVNLGLLSLATSLSDRGFAVKVLDLEGADDPLGLAARCTAELTPRVVGISCLFHSTYLPMQELARRLHQASPASLIVAGGTHVGSIPREALAETAELAAVCAGEAEDNLVAMMSLSPSQWHCLEGVYTRQGGSGAGAPASIDRRSRYDLYPGTEDNVFVLEESRGCPFACRFCSHLSKYRIRPISLLRQELVDYLSRTAVAEPEIVVGSDTCGLSWQRLRAVLEMLLEAQSVRRFRWGTQTRVDAAGFHKPEVRDLAVRSGLASLSLGLESGSPEILRLMHKTSDPAAYLESASRMVDHLGGLEGVALRVNVLVYAGENEKTLAETRTFLESHRGRFSGVHTSVVHAYPGTTLCGDLQFLEERFGTTRIRSKYWDAVHAYPLNPSRALDFQRAHEHARALRAAFNAP